MKARELLQEIVDHIGIHNTNIGLRYSFDRIPNSAVQKAIEYLKQPPTKVDSVCACENCQNWKELDIPFCGHCGRNTEWPPNQANSACACGYEGLGLPGQAYWYFCPACGLRLKQD